MARILSLDPLDPDADALERAASVLRDGGVLAYPTETLYGLGVDPFRPASLERLYRIKGRQRRAPVSILVRDEAMLAAVVETVPAAGSCLIERFLPGPLTLVLKGRLDLPGGLTAGTEKVGVRISSHPLMAHLFSRFPAPFTTTSANPSGEPGASTAGEVTRYFARSVDLVLDAGPAPGGPGSTVVDLTGPRPHILREGAIVARRIAEALEEEGLPTPVSL